MYTREVGPKNEGYLMWVRTKKPLTASKILFKSHNVVLEATMSYQYSSEWRTRNKSKIKKQTNGNLVPLALQFRFDLCVREIIFCLPRWTWTHQRHSTDGSSAPSREYSHQYRSSFQRGQYSRMVWFRGYGCSRYFHDSCFLCSVAS